MEMAIFILIIAIIFLWIGLNNAKTQIKQLRKKQNEADTRLNNLELQLFTKGVPSEEADVNTVALQTAKHEISKTNRLQHQQNHKAQQPLFAAVDSAPVDTAPASLTKTREVFSTCAPDSVVKTEKTIPSKTADNSTVSDATSDTALQYARSSATAQNASQSARETLAKQQNDNTELGQTFYSQASDKNQKMAQAQSQIDTKSSTHTSTDTSTDSSMGSLISSLTRTASSASKSQQAPQKILQKTQPLSNEPSFFDKGIAYAKEWLTTGNIPVKIGMLVLFSAVIAFLRYATAQGWLHIPMEYRLIGVAGAAMGALTFAWKKRETKRSFSLSVQGGSIGILLLDIFAAVKMYGFITPTLGFMLSVLAVLLAATLALKQDAKALIIMAIFAGFLAPIWLSDGTGSHVVLFTYYAVLNLGIFIVSWHKPWCELNLLGFIFTYVIGSTWGGLKYSSAHFASTEPFVILFFLFYLFIPLRYAQRAGEGDTRYDKKIASSLLFGTPLVTLGLQVGLLHDNSTWLAWSCVAMGMVYALLAWILRSNEVYKTLRCAYMGLSATFLTLAVPIGLSAKTTSAIFALEGAGGVWLGCRERRTVTWLAGVFLQLSSAIGFVVAYIGYSHYTSDKPCLLNDWYLSALLIIIGASACLWACYRYALSELVEASSSLNQWLTESRLHLAANAFFIWGMGWWLMATAFEISRVSSVKINLFLFTTITATLLVAVYRYFAETLVLRVQAMLMYLGGVLAVTCLFEAGIGQSFASLYPLSAWDLTVWGAYAVLGWAIWRSLRSVTELLTDVAVTTWLMSLATIVTVWVYQLLPSAWSNTGLYAWAISTVWLVLMLIFVIKPQWLDALATRPTSDWKIWAGNCILAVIAGLFIWVIPLSGGNSAWWLPILNSVDLLALTLAGLIMAWIIGNEEYNKNDLASMLLYAVSALIIGSVTLRMMHHWGGFSLWIQDAPKNWSDWLQLATFGFWITVFWGLQMLSSAQSETQLEAQSEAQSEAQLDSGSKLKALLCFITPAVQHCILVLLAGTWLVLLTDSGNAAPLPWIPILNPLSVLQWGILALMWQWMRNNADKIQIPHQPMIIPVLGLALISVMTLRFVHHWGDITWGASMLKFAMTQMALTVVWSILGVVAWIAGSRTTSRPLWLMGAVLMSVVLIKLVLIDRGHLGNLFGIMSFFAYGLLCVVVGYFAPMPPSEVDENS